MDNKWVGFFAFIWLMGTLMMLTYDGQNTASGWASGGYVGGNTTQTVSVLTSASVASQKLPIVGSISFLNTASNYISTFFSIIVWNFSFVQPYPFVARILNIFGMMGVFMFFRMLLSIVRGNITWG